MLAGDRPQLSLNQRFATIFYNAILILSKLISGFPNFITDEVQSTSKNSCSFYLLSINVLGFETYGNSIKLVTPIIAPLVKRLFCHLIINKDATMTSSMFALYILQKKNVLAATNWWFSRNSTKFFRVFYLNTSRRLLISWEAAEFLTHSFPMHLFSTPWKHQKTLRFSVFRE